MIRRISSYPEILGSWGGICAGLEANAETLAELQPYFEQLKALLEEGRTVAAAQDRAASERQLLAKRLQKILRDGGRLATLLRQGLKIRFGAASDKLVEFGIQPFRSRPRVTTPQEPTGPRPEATVPPSPIPSEPTE